MKLKEKFKQWLDTEPRVQIREVPLETITDEFAINFALFLSDNLYENMYQDIDEDGKTWVSYLHDGYDHHPTARRFTIQELLEIYKKEKGL